MDQLERNKAVLKRYIPEAAVDILAHWVYVFDFKLKIKKSRSTKFGDYRAPIKGLNHQITINHDMNKYAFLITLVHEIAHLSNWTKYKHTVKPHGDEWKREYKILIQHFLKEEIFPTDIINALNKYMEDPAASSCSDLNLFRTLKKYDTKPKGILLEQLPPNTVFKTDNGREFIKGKKIRTRYECKEANSRRIYLFNPLSEVLPVVEEAGEN